jgi:hypothetical protein
MKFCVMTLFILAVGTNGYARQVLDNEWYKKI